MQWVYIRDIEKFEGQEVELRGWLYNFRSSGKIKFLIIRDGTGFIQGVVVKGNIPDDKFELSEELTQESSIIVRGRVRSDKRAPSGFELDVTDLELVSRAEDYPIKLKEHGVNFLMEHRHLWLRTPRQVAIMKIRDGIIRASEEFLRKDGFIKIDAPILTPAACEGTTTLFQTDYFGDKAYLTQSGQLYNEAAALAFGKVYCFGPTFRAEKSKTRRHLMEFWMLEPEMAYFDLKDSMKVQERLVSYIVQTVVNEYRRELEELGRDISKLEHIEPPFPRISYDEAVELLKKKGVEITWGDDFGAPHETAIAESFDKPVFVYGYPKEAKAFYMEPDPERDDIVLAADLLAPEGYGEIIGGGQRIADADLLKQRIKEHSLPMEAFEWYLDLRKFGSVPHSGFGLGIERTVAWIAHLDHVREAIPFARTLNRIYP